MEVIFTSFNSGLVNRGVETYVHELAKRLKSYGIPITVYQSGQKSTPVSYEIHPYKILDIFKKSPNTVIISCSGRFETLTLSIMTKLRGQKLLIPGQSGLGFDDRLNLYTFPDRFIALTVAQAQWATKINPLVKTVVIPNGVDLARFKPTIKPIQTGLPQPIILSVGAFYKEKRHDLLIKAVSQTSASLFIVGSPGPEKERLSQLGQKLLPGRIKIASYPPFQMPSVYTAAQAFVYQTVPWESFGISMLEALASNLPVIATDDPIRRQILGDSGVFVNPENTPQFSLSISQTLSKKWGRVPRLQAEKYSWDLIAKKYLDLIKNL